MNKSRLLAFFALLLATFAWTGVIPVQAHAMLLRSIPEPNAALISSPARIELFFSESVAVKLSRIAVLDSTGKQLNSSGTELDTSDPTHLLASLPLLADGVYVVEWSVISATDGHETTGSFPFTVGKGPFGAGMTGSSSSMPTLPTPIGEMITKGLLYLASAALLGSILFSYLGWNPSLRQAQIANQELPFYSQLLRILWIASLIALVVSVILRLMLDSGAATGTLISWPWEAAFTNFLISTRVGILSIVQLILAGILAILLVPRQPRLNRWNGLTTGLLLLATFCLQCHAASVSHPFVPMLSDFIHLAGVSIWVGGLFAFLAGMRALLVLPPAMRTRLTSILIPHFTTLAMSSVAALIITGIYASIIQIGDLNELVSTPYGKALILKLVIAAPMLALGAINFLFTTPLMRRASAQPGGNPKLVDRFRLLLTGEAVLGFVILMWVGVFTSLPPARTSAPIPAYNQVTKTDDLSITLTIDPFKSGVNTFTVSITSGGNPVIGAKDVSLEFTDLSGMVSPSKVSLSDQGNGVYSLSGGYLSMPGKWDIKVVVIRSGKFDSYADFPLNMGN